MKSNAIIDSARRTTAIASEPALQVVDFFCGCGGTSSGLRAAGMRILAGLDMENDAASTYRENFPEAAFFERDISNLDPAEVVAAVRPDRRSSRLLLSACGRVSRIQTSI